MSLVIIGLGTAVPQHAITQGDAAELAKTFCRPTDQQAHLLVNWYQHTRIQQRGSVLLDEANGSGPKQSFFQPAAQESDLGPTTRQRMERYAQEAPLLALAAAHKALAQSEVAAQDITHLITVSCTGFAAPGVDIFLIEKLGLLPTVGRTHIGFMGCHAALNGLRVAQALADSNPHARILLCAVELCSLHFQYGWEPDRVIANALFADGAAAVVAIPSAAAPQDAWRVKATGSCLFPNSRDAMSWQVGDRGFEMTLSRRVPDLIASHLRPWLEQWLRQQDLTLDQVHSWAIHPGGPRILSSVVDCLGLPATAGVLSDQVLAECGNMSSPTILFILERLRAQQALRPCLALGFGPGLVAESALLF